MLGRAMLCLLSLTTAAAAVADGRGMHPFNRVFTTPAQREALDQLRASGVPLDEDQIPGGGVAGAGQGGRETDSVRFSGYVLRSDGSQMVWVDGQSVLSNNGDGNAGAVHGSVHRGRDRLAFRARSNRTELKAGQLWLLNENRVLENYEAPAVGPTVEDDDASPDSQ